MASTGHRGTVEAVRAEAARLASYLAKPWTALRSYRRESVGPDLLAGLTVAAVAIPQGIAYASIAELPPHYGLYTAVVGGIVGALWGSSRFLSTGPTNANSLLVLSVLLAVAAPGTPEFLLGASMMAVLSGVLLLLLAGLRFGALATLASRPVLLGFTAGAAVLIAFGQARHLLRLEYSSSAELLETLRSLASHIHETHWPSAAIGVATVVLVVVIGRLARRAPAALIAICLAGLAVWLGGLDDQGVRIVGEIPRSLPPPTFASAHGLPDLHLLRSLLLGSTAVAALGLVEALAVAQSLARKAGHRLDPNQEFFGQGLANVATGLLSGYPCAGSLTRSALNHQAGARTRVSGIVAGLAVMAAMLALAPTAAMIPRAALAGVVLVVAYRMVDFRGIRLVLKASASEALIMVVTFGATLALPLEFAVLAGVVISLGLFVLRSSLPRVHPSVPDETFRHFVEAGDRPSCPQLGIVTIHGPLFFGAVHHVEEELRHNHERYPGQVNLVLRMHGVDSCDLTGIEMLEGTVDAYRRLGGDVFFIRLRQPVRELMEESGLLDKIGEDHILPQEGAIEYLFDDVLDPAVCIYECEHRVFAECQAIEKHTYDERFTLPPRHVPDESRRLAPEEFLALVEEGDAVLIDVREPSEFRCGHVAGARSIPLRHLVEEAEGLPRDRPLALVCRSGRRSMRARHMLDDLGFEQTYGLRGGILSWRAAGLPVTAAEDPLEGGEEGVGRECLVDEEGEEEPPSST